VFRRDEFGIYRSTALEELSWLEHGFGTRHSSLWPHASVATLSQIHSASCLDISSHHGCAGEADGLTTSTPGQFLSVRTADCLPVLIADRRRRLVAAVHAGWRGTAARIAVCAVERLMYQHGSAPEAIVAAIGPGIGPCCYEVGSDVAAHFLRWLPELTGQTGKVYLNLPEVNRRQLLEIGVPGGNVHLGAPCTCCSENDFFSYRRDQERQGRMVSIVGIRP